MIFRILFTSLFILMISACSSVTTSDENSIIGLWRLADMQEQDQLTRKWIDYEKKMQGFLLYDANGFMSLHMTIANYEKTDLTFHDLKDSVSIDELKHRSMSYNYMARYEIDHEKNIITHHRISHSNPAEWNTSVKRELSFEADTLILTTLDRNSGQIRVKWIRDIK